MQQRVKSRSTAEQVLRFTRNSFAHCFPNTEETFVAYLLTFIATSPFPITGRLLFPFSEHCPFYDLRSQSVAIWPDTTNIGHAKHTCLSLINRELIAIINLQFGTIFTVMPGNKTVQNSKQRQHIHLLCSEKYCVFIGVRACGTKYENKQTNK